MVQTPLEAHRWGLEQEPSMRNVTIPFLTRCAHLSACAAREAGAWLSVLALSASLAFAVTYALASTAQPSEAMTAMTSDGPYVPDGIPDGADAWSRGKIHLDSSEGVPPV